MYTGGLIYGATPAPGKRPGFWCLGDKIEVVDDDSANNARFAAEALELDGGLVPQTSRLDSARMAGRLPRRGTVSKDGAIVAAEATGRDAGAGLARAG
jgi:hypothetical protein